MNLQAIIVDKFESNSKGRLLVKKKKRIQRKTLKLNVEIRCIVFSRFICKVSLFISNSDNRNKRNLMCSKLDLLIDS